MGNRRGRMGAELRIGSYGRAGASAIEWVEWAGVRSGQGFFMARGWESKSVEDQQAQAAVRRPDPATAQAAEAERKRHRQSLELQRERILSERTSNPHRRAALSLALAGIEEKLAELGWTIHL